ncbi:hypothetical protein D3P08_05795 [Paenibacillus nanensis]|uniref:Uncharacterized protein n=1 Tax=Paenibacillus nanensis TaxID=393251 RepID=A0A3A1VJ45_9BACL|nr:hypothetical protein D3P08_05795 [Paenibacillus nanensis]
MLVISSLLLSRGLGQRRMRSHSLSLKATTQQDVNKEMAKVKKVQGSFHNYYLSNQQVKDTITRVKIVLSTA